MQRYLVVLAFIDRGDDRAVPMHFVVEAADFATAWDAAETATRDREWIRHNLVGDSSSADDALLEPIFDSGIDRFNVVPLSELDESSPLLTVP